jgi:hypothetical protein
MLGVESFVDVYAPGAGASAPARGPAIEDGRRRDIRTQLSDTGSRGVRCAQRHEAEGPNGSDGVGQVVDLARPDPGAITVEMVLGAWPFTANRGELCGPVSARYLYLRTGLERARF